MYKSPFSQSILDAERAKAHEHNADRWEDESFVGYTYGELEVAFKMVRNPDDWKAPIDSVVAAEFVDVVVNAIIFFCATEVEVTEVEHDRVVNARRVESVGYRAGPAGP